MSKSIDERLSAADVLLADGRVGDAYVEYRAIGRLLGLTKEQREHVELGLAHLTAAGVDQDMVIRFFAWLTLVAALAVAASIFVVGGARGGGSGTTFLWALGWGASGACACVLLLRFAELVDRSRATEARLIVLTSKLRNLG